MDFKTMTLAVGLTILSASSAWSAPSFKIAGREVLYEASSVPKMHLLARGEGFDTISLSWDETDQNVVVERGSMGAPGYFSDDVLASLPNPAEDAPGNIVLRPLVPRMDVCTLEGNLLVQGNINVVFSKPTFKGHIWRWGGFAGILAPEGSPSPIRRISFLTFPEGKLPNDNRLIPKGGALRLGGSLDFTAFMPFGDATNPLLVENCDVVLHVNHSLIPAPRD